MCGIVGYISSTSYNLDNHLLALKHRGPDSSGVYYNTQLGLGHTRLSIVDTGAEADQPFISKNQQYIIVFNGEIYNFKALRDMLKTKGYSFSTTSDTEVLLNTYMEYGTDMFTHLDGMFAFTIFDKTKNVILCARDHLGIKPFYYHLDNCNREFFFASELSAIFTFPIKKQISKDAIAEFLFNGWLYEPDTGYQNIYKLHPGEYLQIELDSFKVTKELYFDIATKEPPKSFTTIEDNIRHSIALQSYNEVQIGNFFSGGIDSTVIASLLNHKTKNLTIDYGVESFKEDAYFAKKIASILDLNIGFIEISTNMSALEQIQYVAKSTEDLVSDFTFLATEEISQESKKQDYKIMLSGMGADELFCGYPRYKMIHYDTLYRTMALLLRPLYPILKRKRSIAKKIDRFYAYLSIKSFGVAYSQLLGYFSYDEINILIKDKDSIKKFESKIDNLLLPVKHLSKLKQAMYLDIYGFLSHNFMISDKASMLHSIELRVPLATKEILKKNFYSHETELLSLKKTKLQLRKILYKILPKNYVDRKKAGFNPPLDQIIDSIGKQQILNILKDSEINKYLNTVAINTIIKNHFENKENNTYKIWQLLYLHYWIQYNSKVLVTQQK